MINPRKAFNTIVLYAVGVVTGLLMAIVGSILSAIEILKDIGLILFFLGLFIWITFNLSIGSVVGIQINLVQSLAFVALVKVFQGLLKT